VSGGIVDWTKFNGTTTISQKCLSGEQQVWVSLTEVNDKYSDTVWNCGSSSTTCSEPTSEQRADPEQWLQTSRSYLVLIKNITTTDQGVLTVRLKA
jgi:hypothetical protein